MDSPGDPQIQAWFPRLKPDDYEVTSPESKRYNCIAWAAGISDAWWEPVRGPGYFWPELAPWDDRVESLVEVFRSLRYEVSANPNLENGFEKIAIYGADGIYLHAARQLGGGLWTSKLGIYKDITHKSLDVLTGPAPAFGELVVIMLRPRGTP
jgi:hypothetical protein